ncbi:iron-sulfur cluster biosynthesis transcriptional regulator SufR [Cyanothece sp. BG0011]|uniref:iron-sulfur cluster biosynthesis transcriptional regulator SufR n=1 Tax=Cyanothece sp. BG0011 TaxID=2082950 RepID=UPI000D1F083E|nr:iron-sulfur cluster biosynthesis transcriptional regulator SufR [Cyanothece sp. BG0011]
MTTIQPPSTKEDILQYLLKQGRATAAELAESLEITPQATRRHLKDLETEGLLEHHPLQGGLGRPQYIYSLSKQGRDRFPNQYGEFAVSFLDTLTETMGENQVKEILRKQWQRKADDYRRRMGQGSLKERVQTLVKLRQEEGYMAELHHANEENGLNGQEEGYLLAEHHCAISEVAESYPTVCGHELEMFAEILPDCIIERTHWINEGEHNCGYLIRVKK